MTQQESAANDPYAKPAPVNQSSRFASLGVFVLYAMVESVYLKRLWSFARFLSHLDRLIPAVLFQLAFGVSFVLFLKCLRIAESDPDRNPSPSNLSWTISSLVTMLLCSLMMY